MSAPGVARTVRQRLVVCVLALGGLTSPFGLPGPAPRAGVTAARLPNVVVILTDDQGWGDLGVHGNRNLATPRIDSLARDGALLQHFYVSPVCAPTRAEFLTGRYHPRGGVYGTSARAERLDLDERTMADVFKAAGYATGAFGKWHNGGQSPYHPNARGFDEFYGFTSGHWAHYFDPPLDHNGRIVRGRGFIADDLTDRAIDFMARNRERPFFAYVPYNTPHSPMQVPDRFYQKFAGAELRQRYEGTEQEDVAHTRAALAMVENVDWNVGRILDRLDALGLAQDTIVVFFTDNGPNGWRWNGGLRGRKGSVDEGGIRVPFLIRWPGRIPDGHRVQEIAAAIDLLPTLADLAGVRLVVEKPLDGRSLTPLLTGSGGSWPERLLYAYHRDGVSVRTQRFRLDLKGRLYDIAADPGQRVDVAGRHPAVAARLRDAAAAMYRELTAELGEDDRPLPVGHAAVTELPAGDGVATGAVERSNRFPNASYFRNWTDTGGSVAWDVDVAEAGEYEVTIYYACPKADVGSTLELGFRGQSIRATVTEAHDPPVIGAAEDRVPRIESYFKDFKPMPLGTLRLERGRGPLTLRAVEIPGSQALEVATLVLTRR